MSEAKQYPKSDQFSPEPQPYPGQETKMSLRPISNLSNYKAADKLKDKVAVITGGDSGIGRAVAIAYAMEGANVAIVYNLADEDAEDTRSKIEQHSRCLVIKADISSKSECHRVIDETVQHFGGVNILVNNAAYAQEQSKFEDISEEQLRRVFDTNILACFFLAQAALPHMEAGDTIINTSSVGGVYGAAPYIDYSATKGAMNSFTKALALNLGARGIRVNAVVPGAFWTPFQVGTTTPKTARNFPDAAEQMSATGRIGQPEEIASTYVYLAAADASFTSGSIIEVHGGWIGW